MLAEEKNRDEKEYEILRELNNRLKYFNKDAKEDDER